MAASPHPFASVKGVGDDLGPLSPELVLVLPEELARAARARLPDPVQPAAVPAPAPGPLLVAPLPPRPEPAPRPAPRAAPPRRRARRRPSLGLALGVVLGGGLLVASSLPGRDAPTLATGPPATLTAPRPAPPRALPGAGYVAGGHRRLQVGPDGREITRFVLGVPCLPAGASVAAPIAADGSFAVVHTFETTQGPVTAAVTGRFVDATAARGTIRVRGSGCRAGAVAFVAWLS